LADWALLEKTCAPVHTTVSCPGVDLARARFVFGSLVYFSALLALLYRLGAAVRGWWREPTPGSARSPVAASNALIRVRPKFVFLMRSQEGRQQKRGVND